ncbi:hypothetical protein EVAR_16163_1 [Eumeta japonica]|uniref:Uncharacterized protein n=1 Tax=Eumeta variegata TaxID=151549 RepID=A0A4C1WE92_EUMVA|nr:hypothetical protein EVAR_16163_1 [Eumeta japonica]
MAHGGTSGGAAEQLMNAKEFAWFATVSSSLSSEEYLFSLSLFASAISMRRRRALSSRRWACGLRPRISQRTIVGTCVDENFTTHSIDE